MRTLKKLALHAAGLAALAAVAFASIGADGGTPAHAETAKAGQQHAAAGNLKEGSRGEAVKDLQRELNKNGQHLAVDGIFGPKTRAAVTAFQRAHHLAADGIVGPDTRAALTAAPSGTPRPAPAPSGLRERIVSAATGEIGVTEGSTACGKYVAGTGKSCSAIGWCAAFAEWTWHRAGVKDVPGDLTGRGVGHWGQQHGLFHERAGYTPRPGDLVVYGRPAAGTPGGHVGVVVAVNADGTIDTVEGNYSNKVTHRRHVDTTTAIGGTDRLHISGYVSPAGA